jgi:hypothetical protein
MNRHDEYAHATPAATPTAALRAAAAAFDAATSTCAFRGACGAG